MVAGLSSKWANLKGRKICPRFGKGVLAGIEEYRELPLWNVSSR